jgi:Resolvase, N terminal domain
MAIELTVQITDFGSVEPTIEQTIKREDDMTVSDITIQPRTEAARPKRAVIFARARVVPLDSAQEFNQLRAQRLACQTVAEQLGAGVVATYETCGGRTDPAVRKAIGQLLAQVEGGGINYVIVQGWDRLARRPGELAHIAERLTAAGTRLVTTANPVEAFLQDVSLFCLVAKTNERRSA